MNYYKCEKGYVSDYYYCDYGLRIMMEGDYDENLLYTRDINNAHLFDESETVDRYVYKDIAFEKIDAEVSDSLKALCMKNRLGNIQDKTKLSPMERQYLTKFNRGAKWVEEQVGIHLWDNMFISRIKHAKSGTSNHWKMLIDCFLNDYYCDIYENQNFDKE